MRCVEINRMALKAHIPHTHSPSQIHILSLTLLFYHPYCVQHSFTMPENFWIKQINFLFYSLYPHNFPGLCWVLLFFLFLLSFRHQLIHYFSKFISIGCLLFCIINIFIFVFAHAEPFMFNTEWRQRNSVSENGRSECMNGMKIGSERPELMLYTTLTI